MAESLVPHSNSSITCLRGDRDTVLIDKSKNSFSIIYIYFLDSQPIPSIILGFHERLTIETKKIIGTELVSHKKTSLEVLFYATQPWVIKQRSVICKNWDFSGALAALDSFPLQTCLVFDIDICSREHELNSKLHISLKVSRTVFLKIFGGRVHIWDLDERNISLAEGKNCA